MRQTIARTAATALLALAAAWGNAQDWGNIAVISDTMGNNAGRLCVGEGLRVSDIGCPTYAPSVSTAGHVSITGNVSAQKFIGDGSLLTGLRTASGDRIVSGTNDATRMVAISDTGYISITQSGANSGWFSPYTGLVTLGVSATGGISGTTGYFNGPVGIGTPTPSSSLHVPGGAKFGNIFSSTGFNDHVVILSDAGTAFEGGLLLGNKDSADAANSSVKLAGSYSGTYADLKIGLVSNSAPNSFIRTFIYADGFTGNVGINNNTPVAKLDVNGTISASDAIHVGQSNLLCNSPISGSIRYNITSDTLQVCTGGGWKSLVSGTASAGAATAASSTGAVQFNVNNQLAGDANNFFWDDTNNRLGIGTSDPSFSLMVNGGSGVGGGILSYGSVAPAITVSSSAAGIAGRGTVLMGLATSAGHYFPLSAVGDAAVRSGYGHLYLGTASTTDVILAPSRTEVLRATNGGYVGIGTNTPSSTLHVMNNQDGATIVNLTNVTAGASARSIFLLNGSGAGKSGGLAYGNTSLNLGAGFESLRADALHLYSNGNASGGIALATSNASAPITFNAGGLATAGERMRISGAGLVGVGTQSATATLQVSGTFIVSLSTQTTTPSLYVGADGNVGVGTTSPGARFEIASSNSQIKIVDTDGGSSGVLQVDGSKMRLGNWTNGGSLILDLSANNIGVGNNTPLVSVSVVGEVQVSNSGVACGITTRGAIRYSGTSLQYCNATTWTTLGASGGGLEDRIVSGTTSVIAYEDRSITFSTAGSQRMILDQYGSIGIGTNTPSSTFHIAHSNPRIILTDIDTGVQNWIDANSGGGALAFSADRNNTVANSFMGFSVDGSSILTLRNGKVGISRTVPVADLDVIGTISASDAIQLGQNTIACASGVSGSIRFNTVSNTVQFCNGSSWASLSSDTAAGGSVTGTGSATAVAYWNGPSGLAYDPDGFYWNATSNRLGIGTNAPGYVVHISASSPRFAISNGIGSTYAETLLLDEAGNAKWSTGAYGDSHSNSALRNGYYIYQYTNSSDAVLNQYRLFIADNGNVAVGGSISPAATLQVSGTFTVSSTSAPTSPSIYVNSAGQVAFGTTSPSTAGGVGPGSLTMWGTTRSNLNMGGDAADGSGSIYGAIQFLGGLSTAAAGEARLGMIYAIASGTTVGSRAGRLVFQTKADNGAMLSNRMVIDANAIGINNGNPRAGLDVVGTISASDAIQVGSSSLTCSSGISGSIRYNTTSDTLQICTGSGWKSLVSGTTGGADDLGNHIATQNIQTGPYWISRDGDNEGINISVDGNIGLGVAAVANYGVYNSTSTEATTSTRAGIFNTYVASPTTASAAAYYGDYNNVSYNSDQNLAGSVRGSYIGAVKAGSGAGTVTNMYGSMVYTLNTSSGTVTGMYGLYLSGTNTGGGAVTNYYGLYVPAYGGVAPTTNNYAIYTASAAQDIYLAGSTGIGRTAPVAKLDVLGSISASTIIDFGTQAWGNAADSVSVPSYSWTGDTNTGMYWVSADALGFTAGGAQRGRFTTAGLIVTGYVSTTGAIDIGTQAFGNAADSVSLPSYSWTGDPNTGMYSPAADQVAITTGGVQRILLNSSGVTGAAFLYSSDRRLKKEIVSLSGGLAKLDAINPVSFRFISDTTNREHLGVIAQDVEKVYPQAVVTDENGYKKVDYPALVPVLIGAVKELKAANDNLESAVDKLVSDNREMREEINTLKRTAGGVR